MCCVAYPGKKAWLGRSRGGPQWPVCASHRYLAALVIKVQVDFSDRVGVLATSNVLGRISSYDLSVILLFFYGMVVLLVAMIVVLQVGQISLSQPFT